jgi:AcrR family transcriptional regulator
MTASAHEPMNNAAMTTPRRMGTETSKTRLRLLDVTERLMLTEGYAAVGVRRVAREAGVAPALVNYYFRTLDDLFLAALRRRAEAELDRHEEALRSPQLLRELWAFGSWPTGTSLIMEFHALSNHRKSIRGEMAGYAERLRRMQLDALTSRMADYGIDPEEISPLAILVVISSIARIVVMEEALGLTLGHAETREFVERFLSRLDGEPRPIDTKP